MTTTVQRWGNSLAVRIPKPFAEESHLESGAPVELSMVDGNIVIKPPRKRRFNLKTMLRGITKSNIHAEEDFGGPAGREFF